MTKSRHGGHSVHTDAAKREAMRTGRSVCDILQDWHDQAKRDGDTALVEALREALKFAGCRNRRKRRKK